MTTRIIKKLLSITRNKTKKHDKVHISAKSKLNSIETLVSQALIDMEINHEELITINKISKRNIRKINIDINLKDKYEEMKENLRNINEKLEQL